MEFNLEAYIRNLKIRLEKAEIRKDGCNQGTLHGSLSWAAVVGKIALLEELIKELDPSFETKED